MMDERVFLFPFVFVIGTVVGSFLNVLIDRWSNDQSINGRSHCDFCHRTLSFPDLVPVISFLCLEGKCRYCHKKLSRQYPLVEFITGVIFVGVDLRVDPQFMLTGGHMGPPLHLFLMFGIVSSLIVIFFADLKYRIIPDQIQIVFFVFALLMRINGKITLQVSRFTLSEFFGWLFAGLVVALPILLIYWLSRGRAMGFGDVKLAFNMGILLGTKGGLIALYFAFVIGGAAGAVLLLLKKKKLKSKIAFGPFLAAGAIIMIFFRLPVFAFLNELYGI